jgi:death on curing protein
LPNEPQWLPIEVVIEHNRLELVGTGESHFVRDFRLLESALARPRNFFGYGEEDIVVLAVSLMAGIARGRTLLNRETSVPPSQPMRLFLRANGYDTSFDDTTSWADAVIALVEHRTTDEQFVRAIRPFAVER